MTTILDTANNLIAKFDLTKWHKKGEQFDELNLEQLKAKFQDNLATIEYLGYNTTKTLIEDNNQILKRIKQELTKYNHITGNDDISVIENEYVYNFAKEFNN
jgi:hypothetical protein